MEKLIKVKVIKPGLKLANHEIGDIVLMNKPAYEDNIDLVEALADQSTPNKHVLMYVKPLDIRSGVLPVNI